MSLFGSVKGFANSALGGNLGDVAAWNIPGYSAHKQYGQQQQAQAWNQYVQQQSWAREDTAVQRRVADLKAAGLSPVLAAGSAAESGPVVQSASAQQQDTGRNGVDAAAAVMQMLKAKVDISRTEAETEAIKAQADRTRVQSDIDQQLLKYQDLRSEQELGLMGANTTAARIAAVLHGVQTQRERHDLEVSKDAGVVTRPGWMGDMYRSLLGIRNSLPVRSAPHVWGDYLRGQRYWRGNDVIRSDYEASQVSQMISEMERRGVHSRNARYVGLREMLDNYNRNRRR